jgi:NitT/TauT family transport system substrate-binding protein
MTSPQHPLVNRREVVCGLAALPMLDLTRAFAAQPLTLWGIPATPSALFVRAVTSERLQQIAPGTRFQLWKSTDQMRAGIASGQFRLFATSTYAAANFFNRGAGTRMLNVVTWGVLYVMARDPAIRSVTDLAGRSILLSNKNEAPDLLFRLVLRWAGLDPDRDVRCEYVGSPGEAVPLFLAGRSDVAVLHEPAATTALLRARQEGRPLYRVLDIAELYGRHTGRGARIPQVGLAVSADLLDTQPEIVAAVQATCVEASNWIAAHPGEAAELAAPALGLPAEVIAASLPHVRLDVVAARQARDDIEMYFKNLMELDPGIVGGRLPAPAFYAG